ncbi:MAG: polyprenyl synthetase family protein [Aureliella sp.]
MPAFLSVDTRPYLDEIESSLDKFTNAVDGCPQRLSEAMRYSVLAPGKRLRPLLALFAAESVGGDWQHALPVACAVEFIHVYSLIHDDLPAMDNDDLRRGKPTCHIEFDEATAILAGDSLQMLAIETICGEMGEVAATCCAVLAKASGRQFLVGGQADDLAAEGRFGDNPNELDLEFLKRIHRRKTGALIIASLELGGIAGRATAEQLEALRKYGECIGLAFQIVDDCLDVESTAEQMGKKTRKDEGLGKLTYPSLLGLDSSWALARDQIREATESLTAFENGAPQLREIAEFVVSRRS